MLVYAINWWSLKKKKLQIPAVLPVKNRRKTTTRKKSHLQFSKSDSDRRYISLQRPTLSSPTDCQLAHLLQFISRFATALPRHFLFCLGETNRSSESFPPALILGYFSSGSRFKLSPTLFLARWHRFVITFSANEAVNLKLR